MSRVIYQLRGIPSGVDGIKSTLRLMSKISSQYKKSPQVRELAVRVTNHLPNKHSRAEVSAVQRFVKQKIRYVKDIRGVETVHTPIQVLRLRAGDCDDHSVLVSAMLESIGYATRFKAIGMMPGRYSHVFAEVKLGSRWVSVETTEPVRVGWIPHGVASALVQHVKR